MLDLAKHFIYETLQCEYVILLTIVVVVFCIHGGILDQVNVTTEPWPPQELVIAYKISYTKQQADQHFANALVMLPMYKKIRIIYDRNMRKEGLKPQLIYATGFVLSEVGALPDLELSLFMIETGYQIHKFPRMSYVLSAEHPYRNPLSVKLARNRVYAITKAYIKKHFLCAHPKIEIYGESSILFLAPLHQQYVYYVKEAVVPPKYMPKSLVSPNNLGNKPEE